MWKKFLVSINSIIFVVSSFLPAIAGDYSNLICTRTRGSSVNLRTGPGINYPKGLIQVGSGGERVVARFEQRNYTVSDGELITVFSSSPAADGSTWLKIGTNQWVAWVRSDFVCR
ncbi:hypothetical protein KR51_00006610 [Rubidibacter lacunae KORDI 51-2]|uniref:Uncharacterized protein n=1 Tax=Rubidibacter lacunae KORDI 51-2 TaxID=582515 RepID=U5DP75_9CHRO|nr:hypothetical protein KR51_00006610 [Rubidibacter lacunae KORDI 51-2]